MFELFVLLCWFGNIFLFLSVIVGFFQSLLHCGFGVLVGENFNCLVHYLGSVEKSFYIFGDVFISWWSTDAEGLKRFSAHARSACHLAVAKGDNSFFRKWIKTLSVPYKPDASLGLTQVVLWCLVSQVCTENTWFLKSCSFTPALLQSCWVLETSTYHNIPLVLWQTFEVSSWKTQCSSRRGVVHGKPSNILE